jgi:hypothetical protein
MEDAQVDRFAGRCGGDLSHPWRVAWRIGPSELWDSALGARPQMAGAGKAAPFGLCGGSGYVVTSTRCTGFSRVGVAATAMPS